MSWQFSTVQEFLRQCNWQGTQLPSPPASTQPHSVQEPPKSWQCQTVQGFLSRSNWDGQTIVPPQVSVETPRVETPSPHSIATLPVNQFFNLFVWEAQPDIAAVPQLNSPDDLTDPSDLNLSDFSDLF